MPDGATQETEFNVENAGLRTRALEISQRDEKRASILCAGPWWHIAAIFSDQLLMR